MISEANEFLCEGCSTKLGNNFEVLDRYYSHRELPVDGTTVASGHAVVWKMVHAIAGCWRTFEVVHSFDVDSFREATAEEAELHHAAVRATARRSIIV